MWSPTVPVDRGQARLVCGVRLAASRCHMKDPFSTQLNKFNQFMRYFRFHRNMMVPQIFPEGSVLWHPRLVECSVLISSVGWMGGNFSFSLFPGCSKKEVLRGL